MSNTIAVARDLLGTSIRVVGVLVPDQRARKRFLDDAKHECARLDLAPVFRQHGWTLDRTRVEVFTPGENVRGFQFGDIRQVHHGHITRSGDYWKTWAGMVRCKVIAEYRSDSSEGE